MYSYLSEIISEIQIFNFGYLLFGHTIYIRNDGTIHAYFSKPKGVREQKRFGNSGVGSLR